MNISKKIRNKKISLYYIYFKYNFLIIIKKINKMN